MGGTTSKTAEPVGQQIDQFYRDEIERIDKKIDHDRERQLQVWIDAERDWKLHHE